MPRVRFSSILRDLERLGASRFERKYSVDSESVERTVEKPGVGWSMLAGIIYKKYLRGGFVTATIVGNQRSGKSVYAIKVGYDVVNRLGLDMTYKQVVKQYLAFLPDDLIRKIRRGRWQHRVPVVIWDDAGVHGDAQLFRIDPIMAKLLIDVFRTAATKVASILMTTPEVGDILRKLRYGPDRFVIAIEEVDDEWSIANIYVSKELPSGAIRIYKVGEEEFRRYLEIYPWYLEYRDRYADIALERLEEKLNELMLERYVRKMRLLKKVQEARRSGDTFDDIEIDFIG